VAGGATYIAEEFGAPLDFGSVDEILIAGDRLRRTRKVDRAIEDLLAFGQVESFRDKRAIQRVEEVGHAEFVRQRVGASSANGGVLRLPAKAAYQLLIGVSVRNI
jgi:hypothetical protein